MQLLFIDYTNLIIKEYEERRKANTLSRLLMHPTTANIRQECLNVFNERNNKGEIEVDILKSFFGVPPPGKDFGYIIERYPADKFRSIRSIIIREIKMPSLVNVELLAWLIDFKPRPLAFAQAVFAKSIDPNAKEDPLNDNSETPLETFTEEGKENKPLDKIFSNAGEMQQLGRNESRLAELEENNIALPKKNVRDISQNRKLIITGAGLLAIMIFAGSIYFSNSQSNNVENPYGISNGPCMFWAYDHYESVPCNEEKKGRLFLPLEENKIRNLKMITRKDTITSSSVGHIYYIKHNNEIKYYTAPGPYPEDIKRSLKPLSLYIFQKDSINRKAP